MSVDLISQSTRHIKVHNNKSYIKDNSQYSLTVLYSNIYTEINPKAIIPLFFISVLVILSYTIVTTTTISVYGAENFCKGVKYKDDGDNGYNIIIGTSQFGIQDCIIGTNDKDVIIGLDGQDIIKGKGDNDNLQGGFEDDKIYGNNGHDNIQGGPSQDLLYGNDGNDALFGGFDSDFISGADGNDELYGDFGEDLLEGGRGADYFDCGENYDIVLDYNPRDGDILANNCEQVIKK